MFAHSRVVLVFTLLVALIANIMPLPLSIDTFRPDWVLLVVLYWSIALPLRVNVLTAWIVGLLLDVLLGSILGVHAAAMAVSVYIAVVNYQKIRNFSLWQQAFIIGVIVALYHLIVFWLQRLLLDVVFLPSYLYPVLTSIILWPWVFLILRKLRRQFRIQ